MNKNTWDLRRTAQNTIDAMTGGYFEKLQVHAMNPAQAPEYVAFEGDRAFYRVQADDLRGPHKALFINYLKRTGAIVEGEQ